MIKDELKKRCLPELLPREDMMEILQREEYGILPKNDFSVGFSDETLIDRRFARGGVHFSSVKICLENQNGSHSFPVYRLLHQDGEKHPVILFMNFGAPYHPYFPIEEISESEFDVISWCYRDVTSDDADFSVGIAPLVFPDGRKKETDCGKIGLWAFAAMRVLDYVLTLPGTDAKNAAVAGHSRLGKTALFAGMMDRRFQFVLSNNAGCGGDAIARGGSGLSGADGSFAVEKPFRGETLGALIRRFPYWFCDSFKKYAEHGRGADFDQHFLLASIAPRNVCVNASELDYWADQRSEQLCCLAASEAWEAYGLAGLENCDRYLSGGETLLKGNVGFFMAPTMHFMSRFAWQRFMEFMRLHRKY